MHEMHLIHSLMKKIDEVAKTNQASRVSRVQVRLGALSHSSAAHFREHFDEAARGGVAERARLDVIEDPDQNSPTAQDILLESVDVDIET